MSPTINKRETELFLQAFEKPTQMYRFLREHHLFSPVFLHRNLSYMSGRMSRKNLKRKVTQVDDVCDSLRAAKKRAMDEHVTSASLRLDCFSFIDKTQPTHSLTQIEFVAIDATKSESNRILKTIILSANKENTIVNGCHGNVVDLLREEIKDSKIGKNTVVNIRTSIIPRQQLVKRADQTRRKVYETNLIVFDGTGKCVLSDGEYELKLNGRSSENVSGGGGDHKNLRWRELPRLDGDKHPIEPPKLKFRLVWSRSEMHHRPHAVEREMCNEVSSNCSSSSSASSRYSLSSRSRRHSSSSQSSSSGRGTMTDKLHKPAKNNNNNITTVNKNHETIVGMPRHGYAARIIYRFIYNNSMSQQTETFENWNCPWCKLNCICIDSLMLHFRLMHDRFEFEFTPTSDAVLIDVTIRQPNASTKRQKRKRSHDDIPDEMFFHRSKSTKRLKTSNATPLTKTFNDSITINTNMYATCHQRQVVSFADGHDRLYFHSQSSMPIYTRDEFDVDSEGEPDPEWLVENCQKMVNEFSDVNEGEKELMNMWNAHVMNRNYVGGVQMMDACDNFINLHGHELIRKNLYRNFLLHLTNLYDFGMISCRAVFEMTKKLQQVRVTRLDQKKSLLALDTGRTAN